MQENTFNWCFLGTGTLANNVAKEILKSGRHRIAVSFSRNAEKNAAFAKQYNAQAAGSAEEAILWEGVDAVYVVTPHPSHYALAKKALQLGKPVLCEKPFTMNEQQAKELFDLAKEKDLYIAEAMWTWFAPAANGIKNWLDAGKYGEITYAFANYHMNGKGYAPRVTDAKLGGGAILDVGVYPIHYLIRLFGKPTKVQCTGRLKDGIDWGEEVDLTFENGLTCRASVSIDDWKGLERVEIRGTKARTKVWMFHKANKAKLKHGIRTIETVAGYGGMLNEFDLAAQEIREGKKESAYVPRWATEATMRVLDTCRKQMNLVYPFEQ